VAFGRDVAARGPGYSGRNRREGEAAVGASSWTVRVPWQADIEAALQVARWETFRAGAFHRESAPPEARAMSEDEYVAWALSDCPPNISDYAYRVEWHAAQIDPIDPDSLLAAQPFSGTHSVIDMTGVAATHNYHQVAPFPDNLLEAMFHTLTPGTDEVARAVADGRIDIGERWHGTYVVGYRAGRPDTVFFVGSSGD
jgi:hypothetical protein